MYTYPQGFPMHESFRRRHLPHWHKPNACYFVTTCLAGSIPARGLLTVRTAADRVVGPRPSDPTALARWRRERDRQIFLRREFCLDTAPSVRWFDNPVLARIARDALTFHAGSRYELHAYVVMPSHIHCVLSPSRAWEARLNAAAGAPASPLATIMHSLKSFIAHECRKAIALRGPFWQSESYDRVVRSELEMERVVRYVEFNPVKARLCACPEAWEFSSAANRARGQEP